MSIYDVIQFILFIGVLCLLTPVVGRYMFNVYQGEDHLLSYHLGWLERLTYKAGGVDSSKNMNWKQYSLALVAFNLLGIIFLFVIQKFQMGPDISWHLALNTAISFVTNTNWQSYSGEVTMTNLTQMIGLTVQNFVSAAVGMSVAAALIRGITNKSGNDLGNFWKDLTKSVVYILLPASVLVALILVSQGVVQTFTSYVEATTLEGLKQTIALGPVASQIAIKMLGTNGGGFFNANAAHPFENPTALSNFIQMLCIFVIPAAFTYMFGLMSNAKKHGWLIFGVMLSLFIVVTIGSLYSEYQYGMMEGKETRFGIFNSVLFSSVTTSASCGAVNAMHSSLSPLSGGIALFNMMLGEIIFGGVGAGFYGMMLFILLTVFLSGLMIGRTPEYLGKKIEGKEMMMVILAVIAPCASILIGSGISLFSVTPQGPHGFTEILYAFTSAAANNGSAFAGLNANTPYYNVMLGLTMLIGRFAIILPLLAVAGSLSNKRISPASSGSFEVDNYLFAILLVGVIIIVGALTFLPALSLGPIVEHLLMISGRTF